MPLQHGRPLVALGEVIHSVQSGFASGERSADGVVQLRMNNVSTDGGLDLSSHIRVPTTTRQIEKYGLHPGDVLFNSTNSLDLVGKTAVFTGFPEPVVFSNHFARLRVVPDKLDPFYLAYWLLVKWQYRIFEHLATAWVNQASVRKEDLLDLRLPLPPLAEQQRIAGLLRRADRLRRLRRYALAVSAGYLQAVFVAMFGDPVRNTQKLRMVALEDVCETRLGKMLDAKQQTGANRRPYLRNVNVQWGRIDLTDLQEMDFDGREREILRLRKGDVLVCEGGEVGRTAIWDDELPECYFQKALHRVRPNLAQLTPQYLLWLMYCLASGGGFDRFASQATIAHLTGIELKQLQIPVPPLEDQASFSRVVRQFGRVQLQQEEALRQAEHLFESLLQREFGTEPDGREGK